MLAYGDRTRHFQRVGVQDNAQSGEAEKKKCRPPALLVQIHILGSQDVLHASYGVLYTYFGPFWNTNNACPLTDTPALEMPCHSHIFMWIIFSRCAWHFTASAELAVQKQARATSVSTGFDEGNWSALRGGNGTCCALRFVHSTKSWLHPCSSVRRYMPTSYKCQCLISPASCRSCPLAKQTTPWWTWQASTKTRRTRCSCSSSRQKPLACAPGASRSALRHRGV